MGLKEVDYGLDNFGKPKVSSNPDSLATLIIHLLFLKPGQIPSQPNLGLNITQYLYDFSDSIDTASLRQSITNQAPYLLEYIDVYNMTVAIKDDDNGQGILYIIIPLLLSQSLLAIGIKNNQTSNQTTFNYKIIDADKQN